MFHPGHCLWIPPPLDPEAARRERLEEERNAEEIRRQKEQRRLLHTGRQLEHRRKRQADGGGQLLHEELADFDRIVRQELCASRGAICRAMAFCFEKSACSTQISLLLKQLLLDESNDNAEVVLDESKDNAEFHVETKIGQLFLLSDILFN
jgi:hypothetical protein